MKERDTKRLLVTGASGMVGSYVEEIFDTYELLLTDAIGENKLDITRTEEVFYWMEKFKPDVLLHLAAATDVDLCERDPDTAYLINAKGTETIAKACQKQSVCMVYLSTAVVFDGLKTTPYREEDLPNPVSVYGKSKWKGEQAVTLHLKDFYIIRAGWMMGGGRRDKKFVGKIAHKILSGEKELRVVDDKFGSPTYAKDMLGAIKNLLCSSPCGTYHAVNGFGCSRYDVALEIKSILNVHDVSILPVSSTVFDLDAPRACSEQIMNGKFIKQNTPWMRDWKEALREYLLNEYVVDFNKK